MNRITSPGMPGMNDTVLTYYNKYDIIYMEERRNWYVREDSRTRQSQESNTRLV